MTFRDSGIDPGDSTRVLLVEDDEATAELERRALVRAGFGVHWVASVREAVEVLGREVFCAVLLDFHLPDGEPWEVVDAAHARNRKIPVILVTAMGNEGIAVEAIHRGVSDYFKKTDSLWDQLPGVVDRVARLASAEDRNRRQGALLRIIEENSTDLISISGLDGRPTYLSPSWPRALGYEMEDLLREGSLDLVHAEDRAALAALLTSLPECGAIIASYRCRRKDGSFIWMETTANALADPETGEVTELVAITRDISARMEVQRLKDEFVSIVSHELRTPLTSIKGTMGLVLGGVVGAVSEEARGLLSIAAQNCDRLGRIVDDILDLERMQAGSLTFNFSILDVGDLIRGSLDACESMAQAQGVGIEFEAVQKGVRIRADLDRMHQVLANLISNAVKFSPKGSKVTLRIRCGGGRIRMEVQDRGPGIPETFRERIFQPFSQADASTTRATGGSGLGLNIAKAMVERMGGAIGYETTEGQGSTFHVEFPEWVG